jgi:hypothetical protein
VASYQETEEYDNGLNGGNGPFIFMFSTSGNLPGKRLVREGAATIGRIT